MEYHEPDLHLHPDRFEDMHGVVTIDDLPDVQPENRVRLTGTTPLMEKLWRVALRDIESNLVYRQNSHYFGAGASFGPKVFIRDISFSGILGLNRLYPDIMLSSLRLARDIRLKLGWRVPRAYHVPDFDVPWVIEDMNEKEFMAVHGTNNATRRTDNVIWLWAAADLGEVMGDRFDWQWMYDTGETFFQTFFDPLYDPTDGLYHGQACFIDIHSEEKQTSGYPQNWSTADCVRIKATSTNALYVLGMEGMATAARHLNRSGDAEIWSRRAEGIRQAMRDHLRQPDGTLAYYKYGSLSDRREALGAALAVLAGVLEGEAAAQYLRTFDITPLGVPLIQPFYEFANRYHNRAAWPFVDTLFLRALQEATGEDTTPRNAALLAQTNYLSRGTFCEVCHVPEGDFRGSIRQLWTAAALIEVCRRAGLIEA